MAVALAVKTPTRREAETEPDARLQDYIGRSGAVELKARIESYWRDRGFEIQVMLLEGAVIPALRTTRVDVRSDLVNGLPRSALTASIGGISGSPPSARPE